METNVLFCPSKKVFDIILHIIYYIEYSENQILMLTI